MALRVEQDVLGLEVTIDDVERVQVTQRAGDLGGVEARPRLQEAALALQVVEELRTNHRGVSGSVAQDHVSFSDKLFRFTAVSSIRVF